MMRRFFLFVVLACLLTSFGCSAPSYYIDIKQQGVEEAIAANSNGVALAARGMHEEAIVEFRRAVALDPVYSEAYLNLSKSYYAIDNLDFALYNNIKYGESELLRDFVYEYRLY